MKIALISQALRTLKTDLLAVGVRSGHAKKDDTLKALDKATRGALFEVLEHDGFKGSAGETAVFTAPSGLAALRLVVIGLGSGETGEKETRAFGAKAAQIATKAKAITVVAPGQTPAHVRALAEGLTLGAYKYTRFLTGERKPKSQVTSAQIVMDGKPSAQHKRALHEAASVADAVALVRDLVNAPPNVLTATALADEAKKAAEAAGIECTVLGKKQIEHKGMHLFLAVNKGSTQEPRFIHLAYKPKDAKKKVVFVGKGLVFDSGGLCLKNPKGMLDMKCDMAGGALTIATVVAAAKLGLPIEVHGVVPATDNMTGGDAYKPGDVWPSLDGKTVEIINTDAEGRLILADALAYARELGGDYLIDHATLTGACIVALGPYTAGLYANDEELAGLYQAAATQVGESVWRLPLNDELRDMLKSDIADLKHTGEQYGGSITAALFLREFVGRSKWIHMDIAGPAFGDRAHGLHPKGGTGFGVLTAVRFVEGLAKSS